MRPQPSLSTWQSAASRKLADASENGLLPAISSLSYTPKGSTDDPFQPHGLSLIDRLSDTPGFCGVDIMPIYIVLARPLQDRAFGELRPVVADNTSWLTVDAHKRIQFPRDPNARYAGICHQAQVLATTIIIHSQHAELA
jgi:hypothetical protein